MSKGIDDIRSLVGVLEIATTDEQRKMLFGIIREKLDSLESNKRKTDATDPYRGRPKGAEGHSLWEMVLEHMRKVLAPDAVFYEKDIRALEGIQEVWDKHGFTPKNINHLIKKMMKEDVIIRGRKTRDGYTYTFAGNVVPFKQEA